MTMNENDECLAAHDAAVDAVANAVFELMPAFAKLGYGPEPVFEGLIKAGVSVILTGAGLNRFQCAELLEDFAAGLKSPDDPSRGKLHVVK